MPDSGPRILGSLAPAEPREALLEALGGLPSPSLVHVEGPLQVRLFRGDEAPSLLSEVGRVRELTFRHNGEGTGFALALDAFDDVYLHLAVWDDETSQVIAGIRLGVLGGLLRADGSGSSTGESFEFAPAIVGRLRRGIELGRAFVVPSWPRPREPLALLWRGLGAVLDREQQCRLLLGRIPIPPTYSPAARKEIASFLLHGKRRSPWAESVRAREPYETFLDAAVDAAALERRVFELEGRRPPLLVTEYSRLGMRGLAAAKDTAVRGRVHVLCLADLRETQLPVLREFLGTEAADRFAARHPSTASTVPID